MPTLHFGLTGHPLGHSLSPKIHAAALNALGLVGDYQLFPIPPLPDGSVELAALLTRLRRAELHGLNVTIPHKQTVISWLDRLTPTASAIGAVNTIIQEAGQLVGDNTDAPGFLADLRRVFPSIHDRPGSAIVLGCGGGARAVVYALAHSGWRVSILPCRLEDEGQAQGLAADLSQSLAAPQPALQAEASSIPPRSLPVALSYQPSSFRPDPSPALIVNCTPLGMFPDLDANPWPAGTHIPNRACVYDLVYNPPETGLLRSARLAGLPAASGLGMLVEQAALSFERWVGKPAPRQEMRAAVETY